MLDKNCKKILKLLTPRDTVLDIGGWAMPFNRANYVVDLMPYESRGIHGSQGPQKEYFSRDRWIIKDISSQKLPFKDKALDFVICSHILEDIKNPLFACSEIIRVGKRGYIEVPSRTVETIIGIEGSHYAGYAHHHWLIDIKKGMLTFRFKNHFIHHSWKYHLPHGYIKKLTPDDHVSYLFWENTFRYEEIIMLSSVHLRQEMEAFVKNKLAYPNWYYYFFAFDTQVHTRSYIKNFLLKRPGLKRVAVKLFGDRVEKGTKEELFWQQTNDLYLK